MHAHSQVEALGLFQTVTHPDRPALRLMKPALMMDGSYPELRLASPAVGEHSADVLREAGFGADEIATLMEARVIA